MTAADNTTFSTIREFVCDVYLKNYDETEAHRMSYKAIVSIRSKYPPLIRQSDATSHLWIHTNEADYYFPEFEVRYYTVMSEERQVPVISEPDSVPTSLETIEKEVE